MSNEPQAKRRVNDGPPMIPCNHVPEDHAKTTMTAIKGSVGFLSTPVTVKVGEVLAAVFFAATLPYLGVIVSGPAAGALIGVLVLALIVAGVRRLARREPATTQLVLANGLGWEMDTLHLLPGQTAHFTLETTHNVCDRGFPSEDGVHRLISRTYTVPVSVRVAKQT